MTRIGVLGAGHVGLVVAAGWSQLGHSVVCVDRDEGKIRRLQAGDVPFIEPGLPELVKLGLSAGGLAFSTSSGDLAGARIVFVSVDAPASALGVDARNLLDAVDSVAFAAVADMPFIVIKSTVTPGTTEELEDRLARQWGVRGRLVVNPEFLREGSAVKDFFAPDRIVIGSSSRQAVDAVSALYDQFPCPIVKTSVRSAELIKLASNAFLASRVALVNEIAALCSVTGAAVDEVFSGVGLDHRIGPHYLRAGLGFGGSCLPKDVRMLAKFADSEALGLQLLPAILEANEFHLQRAVSLLSTALGGLEGRVVAVLGLTFKPGTDDFRESPSTRFADELMRCGALVSTCDPVAGVSSECPEGCLASPYQAADCCDATVIATPWPEFQNLDYGRLRRAMRGDLIMDVSGTIDVDAAMAAGFRLVARGTKPSRILAPLA